MKKSYGMSALFALLLSVTCVPAQGLSLLDELARVFQSRTDSAPASGTIETGFSPDGGAERLVLKAINSSRKSLHVAAYSFTSPVVVGALVNASKRGVQVQVVVDGDGNRSRSSKAALNLLASAGIAPRTNDNYAIHHDKYIIVDGLHVQTGSFNYSKAAASSNSENVIVIWNNADLAASYMRHWQRRYNEAVAYKPDY